MTYDKKTELRRQIKDDISTGWPHFRGDNDVEDHNSKNLILNLFEAVNYNVQPQARNMKATESMIGG